MHDLQKAAAAGLRWLEDCALPLWATRGFDPTTAAFEEQLDFEGNVVMSAHRRLMVQARQIATFSAAALSNRYGAGRNLALAAGYSMVDRYHSADGAPGFVFSVDRGGHVIDRRRDLYGHAFALFAFAWLLRLKKDAVFVGMVDDTLDVLDRLFADPENGGYFDCLPRSDILRRQNPHMHLFEAFLVLFETTRREDILARCRSLRELVFTHFVDIRTGALREYFDNDWNVYPALGQGSVEPGHLFEWVWLLRRYETITGEDQTLLVEPMLAFGMKKGLDANCGRVVDEIGEDGELHASSSRCWPHTEALKALTQEVLRGEHVHHATLAAIFQRLLRVYCIEKLNGGWIDHVGSDDIPLSPTMPASSLYHIYFGMVEVAQLVNL